MSKDTNTVEKRDGFQSKWGFILACIGSAVGMGNIWRFPIMVQQYGGMTFLLPYFLFVILIGSSGVIEEFALGRRAKAGPVGAFGMCTKERTGSDKAGKAIGAIPIIGALMLAIGYTVVLGWIFKYTFLSITGGLYSLGTDMGAIGGTFGVTAPEAETLGEALKAMASAGFFGIGNGVWQIVALVVSLAIMVMGIAGGIEKANKIMMPVLVVLAVVVTIYSVTRPGAVEGMKYFLIPNVKNFSWMTVVAAMGQMFYSLSIAMGILITFGSYMKKDTSIEKSTENVEIFDTAIAIMAGLMIIPAVFAFSGGNAETLKSGPALMFITIPKVFANMGFGTAIGIVFFLLVLFAAVTSSIALTESAVSTFEDELHWSRKKSTVFMGMVMLLLGTLSCLGYGPLANFKILGMQFLDFFDFITNSVMMPIAAIATCLLVSKVVGVDKIEEEITKDGQAFRRKKIFCFMIKYLCPLFAAIILISSVANAFGIITM